MGERHEDGRIRWHRGGEGERGREREKGRKGERERGAEGPRSGGADGGRGGAMIEHTKGGRGKKMGGDMVKGGEVECMTWGRGEERG